MGQGLMRGGGCLAGGGVEGPTRTVKYGKGKGDGRWREDELKGENGKASEEKVLGKGDTGQNQGTGKYEKTRLERRNFKQSECTRVYRERKTERDTERAGKREMKWRKRERTKDIKRTVKTEKQRQAELR